MKIRTLIADDMKLARTHLRHALAVDPSIEIIGECRNGRETISAVRTLSPDLLFLDVQMPKMSGFDVVNAIGVASVPSVVFVTAHDEFALKAFEVNALDYLLKPLDADRLRKTITRVKRQLKSNGRSDSQERLRHLLDQVHAKPRPLKRISVKTANHTAVILTEDIEWVRAAGNYLEIHVGKDVYLIRDSLAQFEQKLDPEQFLRIHRSMIVNIDQIKALYPMFNGDNLVVLRNGAKLNSSRTYRDALLAGINA